MFKNSTWKLIHKLKLFQFLDRNSPQFLINLFIKFLYRILIFPRNKKQNLGKGMETHPTVEIKKKKASYKNAKRLKLMSF